MSHKTIISLLLLTASVFARGQYYDTGQDPASLKWEKLESHHFNFIYPESYSDRIDRVVYSFERAYELLKGSYKEPLLGSIPVIIHNHTTRSNGYVAWAPKRIELYPSPGQDNIPMGHIEQLALHELMHVLQMHSFRRGISRTLSYIFGEQYTGALGIYTPYWFLEGEAVIAESAWSYSGRGRVPSFEKKLRALLLEKDNIYSYDKMILGSYNDFTPNHYQFGYQMTAWARTQFGDDTWQKPMDYTALKPYTLNPFNRALRKYTNHSKEDIYYETMVHLKKKWKEEEQDAYETYTDLNPLKDGAYINYYSPVAAGKDSIIAIKTSLDDIPAFVLINTSSGQETILHRPGKIWPYRIRFSGNILVWAEDHSDPRWQNLEYSVIKTLDIKTGHKQTLTKKSRLFGPDISPDSRLITASESTESYENNLVIMDAASGLVKNRHPVPGNKYIAFPSWSDDMEEITFISSGNGGEGIMSFKPSTGEWKTYLKAGRDDLQSAEKRGSSIFFVSSASGIDNAFRMDKDGRTRQLTSSRFGISGMSVSGGNIFFSDYSAGGNNIASGATEASPNLPGPDTPKSEDFIDKLNREEKLVSRNDYSLPANYEKKRYSKAAHLFRFHSWMPFYADVNNISFDEMPVNPGITLLTQNNLSTVTGSIAYEYNNREHLFHSNISWKGWYPAIDFNMSYGGEPSILRNDDTTALPASVYRGLSTNTTIYIPLHFNRGSFIQTLWPSVNVRYSNNYVLDEEGDNFDYGQTLINSRLYMSNLRKMSYRDIWPKFGQVADLYHTRSLFDSDLYGPVTSLRTTFYFPGIFRNHSIKFRYQYEKQEFRRLLMHNRLSFPRAYKHLVAESLNSFSLDYAFPVSYPDLELGNIMYISRIRNTAFYDHALGNGIYDLEKREMREGKEYFSSTGIQLLADFYLLRIPVRLSAGIQAAWVPSEKRTAFEFLLNMDVFGFVLGENYNRPY